MPVCQRHYSHSERLVFPLFKDISVYEAGSGAKLNKSKTEAMWLGAWINQLIWPFIWGLHLETVAHRTCFLKRILGELVSLLLSLSVRL